MSTPAFAENGTAGAAGPTANNRALALAEWRSGGETVKAAAERALAGTDEQVAAFLATELPRAFQDDERLRLLQLVGVSGPGVRKAAEPALAGQKDVHAFLESGWKAPWVEDQRASILKAMFSGGVAVNEAGNRALDAHTTEAYTAFLGEGLRKAQLEDDRVQVLRLMHVGGPKLQAAGSTALDGGPDAVREFLDTEQHVARAQDQESMTISQLVEDARQASQRAKAETESAKEASGRAVDAARLAKEAAQRAKDETAAAQSSTQDASAAAGRAASAAESAATAASTAVTAANNASNAARTAAAAASSAAAASAAAGRAAARAYDQASAAAKDKNQANAAKQAAKDARDAALGATNAAKAVFSALTAMKEALNAGAAAFSASDHAAAASQAASEAGSMANVSAAESRHAKIAADRAKRAAATARSAATSAQAAAQQAMTAADEAKTAAEKSAAHANAAAAAAEDAAAQAGQAGDWAGLATKHAEAALTAADNATTAANQAESVEATARVTETSTREASTALAVLAAEEEARQEAASQAKVEWERAETARQDEDTKRLLAEATASGTASATAVLKGRQAAVRLLSTGAPWTSAAAEYALVGGDVDVKQWLSTGRRQAAAQDDHSKISHLATSQVTALRTAAEKALSDTAEVQAAFLESGQYSAMRDEYRAQVLVLMNAGGPAVQKQGSAALDAGTPEALRAFLAAGQYTARREDDRAEALKLIYASSPRVQAASQAAMAAPNAMLRDFIAHGQYEIAKQDYQDAVHIAEVRRMVADGKVLAANARQDAAEAASAAATARGAAAEAAGYAQQASDAATAAQKAAADAKKSAVDAEQSAKSAVDSVKRAKAAATSASNSATAAQKSASWASTSAAHAKVYAQMARVSAEQARQSALAANQSALEAMAVGREAWESANALVKKEQEERRKQEQNGAQPGTNPPNDSPPVGSGIGFISAYPAGTNVIELGGVCYVNGYALNNPLWDCGGIASSFDKWLLENGGDVDWRMIELRPDSVMMPNLLMTYCEHSLGFGMKPYRAMCGDDMVKKLKADGGFVTLQMQEASVPKSFLKPLLRQLGIRTSMTLRELSLLSPRYQAVLKLTQTQIDDLVSAYVRFRPLADELAAAGKLGPSAIPSAVARMADGWKRYGGLTREQFVGKYWNPQAWTDAAGKVHAGWNYPKEYAIEGTKRLLAKGEIKAGEVWDRFGESNGRWLSPASENASFAQRAIPPDSMSLQYYRYKWAKDLDEAAGAVERSKVAGWFEQPGGATQFKLQKSVQELCIEGYLVFENGMKCA
ncbi:glycohydrolase toxin TNT-related protein [Kitasatospora sp. NPDC091276]|uniref:glycohydrolase toxin TNT-related protein n=1 Tax=Kitasatospora sp. NPDC091276 TaxID=3155300 RepID=UPI00344AAFB4